MPSLPHFLSTSSSQNRHLMSRDEKLMEERMKRALPIQRDPIRKARDAHVTWLELFTDLLFVATLSVVTSTNEAVSPGDVGSLIAFIVLLWWTWTSYVFFCVRYAQRDLLLRFLNFFVIAVFVFLGAYSTGFRPYLLKQPFDYVAAGASLGQIEEPSAETVQAWSSWPGITVAYAVGRLVLFLHYAAVMLRFGLPKRNALPLLFPMFGAVVGGWVAFGVHFISASDGRANSVRVGLLFGAVAFEMILAAIVGFMDSPVSSHTHLLIERFALLTLIILGEGFLGLSKKCFCAIAILVALFHILFDSIDLSAGLSPGMTHIYGLLHLPLHITLLLAIQGILAVILGTNLGTAINVAIVRFDALSFQFLSYFAPNETQSQPFYLHLPDSIITETANDLELLGYSLGGFNRSLSYAATSLVQSANYLASQNSTFNRTEYLGDQALSAFLLSYGTLLLGLASQYELPFNEELSELQANTFSADGYITSGGDITLENFNELLAAIINSISPGVLFLLPTLGGVLLMSTLLTYVQRPPKDIFDFLLLGPRALIGFALCMLGFLDLGQTSASAEQFLELEQAEVAEMQGKEGADPVNGVGSSLSPILRLASSQWLLPLIVLILVLLVIGFETVVLFIAKRRYKRESRSASRDETVAGDRVAEKGSPEKMDSPTNESPDGALGARRSTDAPLQRASSRAADAEGRSHSHDGVRDIERRSADVPEVP